MTNAPHVRTHPAPVNRGRRRFAVVSLLAFGAVAATAAASLEIALSLTPQPNLNAVAATSAIVIDRDGHLLRAYTAPDGRWRLPVANDQVDPRFVRMLLAFEDRRFRDHGGVDMLAIGRAAAQAVRHRRLVSGASTLTMQVARLVSRRHERTLRGKVRQALQAVHLERALSKDAILNLYLRLAPYGGNLEGIRAATLSYFGKEPKRLTISEAALLVALPQSPERRRLDGRSASAKRARDHVLAVARLRGVITRAEELAARRARVPARRLPFPKHAPHLADEARAQFPDRAKHSLTLDRGLQQRLQRLAATSAKRLGPKLSVAIIAADHRTGDVRAMVGGPGLLDHARHGAIDMTRATRSPGSTLKPLIYGLAFDRGMAHPETLIEDKPARFGSYKPRNFNEGYRGTVTVREALAASLNIPAVKVLDRLGPGHLVGRLAAAGVRTDLPDGVAPDLAIALGGIGTDLRALTSLYAALANRGEIRPLRWHASAPDAVLSAKPRTGETRILSAAAAYDIARILRSAPPPPNARGGRIAFKTGTSYGHRDAWAVGFDGAHVIGVWVGRADGTATPDLAGREAAAPILFDAFHRTAKSRTPLPKRPNGARRLSARDLPPPLKRFGTSRPPRRQQAFLETPLAIAFPLDRTEVAHAGLGDALPVTAEGGALPLTWLVDGRPIAVSHSRRTFLNAATTGFVEISVVDADGQTARASVRLLAE